MNIFFTPRPLRLWDIVITRGRRAGGRSVRNSALTKKLTDEFRLLAPAVTVGETEGAMDSTSVFFLPLLLPITL